MYRCKQCKKEFEKYQNLANHIRWYHKKISYSKEAREKMSKATIKSNNNEQLKRYKCVENFLKNINYNILKKAKNMTQKEIIKDLKGFGCQNPKVAIKILMENVDKSEYYNIVKSRKSKKLSTTMKEKINNDLKYRLQLIKQFTKRNGQKYRSNGELKIKNWLTKKYPDFIWKTKHFIWKNEGFEIDIYSKKYNDFYIEYNGIIHYKRLYEQQKFDDIKRKDKLKEKYMKINNYKFLIIKDEWNFEKQIKILNKWLKVNS